MMAGLRYETQIPRPPTELEGFSYSDGPIFIAWPEAKLSIGKYCSIARNVRVFLGGNHQMHHISTFPFHWRIGSREPARGGTTKGDVVIGNDVWIGDSAVIMSGSQIGNGAVIGAYSVVAGKIPAYAVAAGNPARVRRYRFSLEVIVQLQELAWWDWPPERVAQAAEILESDDIKALIKFGRRAA